MAFEVKILLRLVLHSQIAFSPMALKSAILFWQALKHHGEKKWSGLARAQENRVLVAMHCGHWHFIYSKCHARD